jgi:hypothetical protein
MITFSVLHARAMARLETLVTTPRTPAVLSDMQNLATGLAIFASPNLPGTELPPDVAIVNEFLLARLGIPVVPAEVAEFAAKMCAAGH